MPVTVGNTGKESKYQQASTFLENLKPRAGTFSTCQQAVQVPHSVRGQGSHRSFPPWRAHTHVTLKSRHFVVM